MSKYQDIEPGEVSPAIGDGKWTYARFPALADGHPGDPTPREPGQLLSPRLKRGPLEVVQARDPDLFAGQYQGRPMADVGRFFQESDFQIIERHEVPERVFWVLGLDLAAKASQHNDYTAGALCGVDSDHMLYIKEVFRWKLEFPDARREIIRVAAGLGNDVFVGIEDAASGTPMLQDLMRVHELVRHTILSVKVKGDKKFRAQGWASRARAGRMKLVRGEWNRAFINECMVFDGRSLAHDDQVDAVSVAWAVLHMNQGERAQPKPGSPALDNRSQAYFDALGRNARNSDPNYSKWNDRYRRTFWGDR